jgi:hypothetical protein
MEHSFAFQPPGAPHIMKSRPTRQMIRAVAFFAAIPSVFDVFPAAYSQEPVHVFTHVSVLPMDAEKILPNQTIVGRPGPFSP